MRLASKDLFQRCLRGATQNAESFNGLVWSHYCLYGNFVELIQWNACSLVVLQFNNCAKAIQDVLEEIDWLIDWFLLEAQQAKNAYLQGIPNTNIKGD